MVARGGTDDELAWELVLGDVKKNLPVFADGEVKIYEKPMLTAKGRLQMYG